MNYQLGYLGVPLGATQATEKPLNICQLLGATHCKDHWPERCVQLVQTSRIADGCNTTKLSETRTGSSSNVSWARLGPWGGTFYAVSAGSFISVPGYGYQCYYSHLSLHWHLASLGKWWFLQVKNVMFKCLWTGQSAQNLPKAFYIVDSGKRDV